GVTLGTRAERHAPGPQAPRNRMTTPIATSASGPRAAPRAPRRCQAGDMASSPVVEPEVDETVRADRRFFGHPLGVGNLAGVEMWERFSFYGMQAILAFYLYYRVSEGGLGLTEVQATSIVGAYGGLVYLSAILGAWVADRVLGAELTLTYGAGLILAGHVALAVLPGFVGVGVGLVCVAIGSGTLKATTSSVLGEMYAAGDDRRDAGFSIYYMGVNIGALLGPL